jgi:hypothetical protein
MIAPVERMGPERSNESAQGDELDVPVISARAMDNGSAVLMVTAVVAGVITVVLVGLIAWRGGAGRAWYITGTLIEAIAGEVSWYGQNHGWQEINHDGLVIVFPIQLVGVGAVMWGVRRHQLAKRNPTAPLRGLDSQS